MAKSKHNWMVDALLFIGFLLTFFLELTGLEGHQWLGVGIGILALYHLLIHWKWVLSVTRRFFGPTSGQSRLYYFIDWSLMFSGTVIGVSGLLISTWLNIDLANYLLWKNLHVYSSIAGLAVTLIKIGTHWRWIVKTASQHFGLWRQPVHSPAAVPVHLHSPSGTINRREFLQLMGVASLASLISASNLLKFGQQTGQEIILDQTSSTAGPDIIPGSSSCILICDRGCAYPGECRRYVDQNSNGICDLSECLSSDNTSVSQAASSSMAQEHPNDGEITSKSTEECDVICPSGCSYPGECRDYIDNNANGLCDLGECLVSNTSGVAKTSHGGRKHRGGN